MWKCLKCPFDTNHNEVLIAKKQPEHYGYVRRSGWFVNTPRINCNRNKNWGCRICWLHFCREINLKKNTSTSVLDMTLNCIWWWGFSPGKLGNIEYPFTAIFSGSLRPGVIVSDRVSSMGQIELFHHLTVLTNDWY